MAKTKKRLDQFANISPGYEVLIAKPDGDEWDDWRPQYLDENPDYHDYEQTGIIDDDLMPSLRKAHQYNADRMAEAAGSAPRSWAVVVWHENRAESSGHPRHECTPLRYITVVEYVPPTWRPAHWLDCPACEMQSNDWSFAGTKSDTLEDAAEYAIRCNRNYFSSPPASSLIDYQQRSWHYVLAVENDARETAVDASYMGRGLSFGTVHVVETRRFHIVTPDWPFSEPLDYQFTEREAARFERHFAKLGRQKSA